MRYDTKSRHSTNLWEGRAELDQDLLLLGDGSLLLHKPDTEEHSGLYTCVILGLQSKHIVQTRVNITASSLSEYQVQSLENPERKTEVIRTDVLHLLCRCGRAERAEVLVEHCSLCSFLLVHHHHCSTTVCEAKRYDIQCYSKALVKVKAL